jgi:SAM-dependent methyltransferase
MSMTQELLNQATWSSPRAQRELDFHYTSPFTDPGESMAVGSVESEIHGVPMLDLGVGTGRTIPLFESMTDDYQGIDYLVSMVQICNQRYPRTRVRVGDARELGAFPSDNFGFVQFSFNGIDAIPREGRIRVLREVRRVLRPGGIFLFSTLNLDGPGPQVRPWRLKAPSGGPLRLARWVTRTATWAPVEILNWLRIRDLGESGDGYAVLPLPAHHFRVLANFIRLERQLDDLRDEGFAPDIRVYDNKRGARVRPGDDTSSIDWFHFVARKARY